MLRKTSLHAEHLRLSGKMVDFGGWDLPIQYSGVIDEHLACRTNAGIFDVSHMGEIDVHGERAEEYLNFLVTNDVSKLTPGQAQYTVMCHEDGGIVDDLVIYRRASDHFLLVVNASNKDKDFQHLLNVKSRFNQDSAQLIVSDVSSSYTQIAVQGPKALQIVSELSSEPLNELRNYCFTEGRLAGTIPSLIARTGYTGEDGFELYVPWEAGPELWQSLLEVGTPLGMKPCGLGARDTLRLEMKYPLYGNELSDTTHPLEAGLAWVVKLGKNDFMGRPALLRTKELGISRQLVGIKMLDKGIPRHGYSLYSADGEQKIGELTSGTQSPSLRVPVGIGFVDVRFAKPGTLVTVEIRGARIPAEIVPTPFYRRTH
jgi:aminomethyltransferase